MKRLLRKIPIDFNLISIVLLSICIGSILFFIPPQHIVAIIILIISVTAWGYFVSCYFVQKKYRYIIAFSIFLFLCINYIVGFDLINTVLLASFIIGLTLIIK